MPEKEFADNLPEIPAEAEEAPEIHFEIYSESIASETHPDRNEDAHFQLPEKKAYGVFDGVGGSAGGEAASRIAKAVFEKGMREMPADFPLEETEEQMRGIFKKASEAVSRAAEQNQELRGMATTASAVKIWEGGGGERKAIIGNIGDSRVYRMDVEGKLELLTLDDNLGIERVRIQEGEEEARRLQAALNEAVSQDALSEEARGVFRNRNIITQALGQEEELAARISAVDMRPGDTLLISSDGIHDNLTDTEIAQHLLRARKEAKDPSALLADAASRRSRERKFRSKRDDMTALVVEAPIPKEEKGGGDASDGVSSEERKEGFRIGESVAVLRSSGTLERKGWKIAQVFEDRGEAVVVNVGENVAKHVRLEDLQEWNKIPERREASFADVRDWKSLYEILQSTGSLAGTRRTYSAEELIDTIERVRKGELAIDSVTRTGGLRKRVGELFKMEQLRRRL